MFPLVPYHALPKLHAVSQDDMPDAISQLDPRRLARDHPDRSAPGEGSGLPRKAPPARPRNRARMKASALRSASPMQRAGSKSARPLILGRADVIRFDHGAENLRPLSRRGRQALRHRRHLHPRQHPSLRRPGERQNHRVPQAQRALQLLDGSPARRHLSRPRHLSVEERDGASSPQSRSAGGDWRRELQNTSASASSATAASPPSSRNSSSNRSRPRENDRLHARRLSAARHSRLRFHPLPRLRHSRALRHRLGEPARLRPRRAQPRSRPPQQLLARQQPAHGAPASLQRPHRYAAARPGLPARAGSSYVFSLKPGDTVTAIGPFGDFQSSPPSAKWSTSAAAPAWLRCAPISRTFSRPSNRAQGQLLVWRALAAGDLLRRLFPRTRRRHPNFSFHLALSLRCSRDNWTGHAGFIHEVVLEKYLREPSDPRDVEYYLCGPPMMIKAVMKMLTELGVSSDHIAFDEF